MIDTGDTAWVLISAALVFFMTPGLALFYGGMVRSKNVLTTISAAPVAEATRTPSDGAIPMTVKPAGNIIANVRSGGWNKGYHTYFQVQLTPMREQGAADGRAVRLARLHHARRAASGAAGHSEGANKF